MRFSIFTAFATLTGVVSAWEPNKGPECKLTCRNRVSREHCPAFHYVGGTMKTCAHSQYGCTDKDLNDCGAEFTPPPLCVVNGPCYAGPAGCREDKTGADDGLPAGEYVGHCPEPQSPESRCVSCRDSCAARFARGTERFELCLQHNCRSRCYGGLLYKVQYSEAKHLCTELGHANGDVEFQSCIKENLNGTIPENYRCHMQFTDTETYCIELGYTRGDAQFQGCVKKSFDGICSDEFRCQPQFRDARKFCIREKHVIGGPDFQKCISEQLLNNCPKDIGCKKRHTDAREFCKKENTFGSPEFQSCVSEMLDPTCAKDFQCDQRKGDTAKYCSKQGFEDGTSEYNDCMKEALGKVCPDLPSFGLQVNEQEWLDL